MPRKPWVALAAAVALPLALALSRSTFAVAGMPVAPSASARSFLPSRSGLPFLNPSPRPGATKLEAATAGRCGGMAFAALDYHRRGIAPVAEGARDPYVLLRNVTSLIDNGARFLSWSTDPTEDRWWRGGSVGTLTREREVPRLAAALAVDAVPLGLTRAANPGELSRNHQVVAYGLTEDEGFATVRIYDPNHPGDDSVVLEVALDDPGAPILQRAGGEPVAAWTGLFVADYATPRIAP